MGAARIGARVLFLVSLFFIAISFSTPYWLQSDGLLPYQRFHKVGLWEICYTTFQESSYLRYNNQFRNCRWIFDRDYYYLIDLFETGMFFSFFKNFTLNELRLYFQVQRSSVLNLSLIHFGVWASIQSCMF